MILDHSILRRASYRNLKRLALALVREGHMRASDIPAGKHRHALLVTRVAFAIRRLAMMDELRRQAERLTLEDAR